MVQYGLSAQVPLHNFYVAHMITPLPDGAQIMMHSWPQHITLAGNFFTGAEPAGVAAALAKIATETKPLSVALSGTARFGAAGEYMVRTLELTPELGALHNRLAQLVDAQGCFEHPEFTLDGYHPHITVVAGAPTIDHPPVQIATMTLFDIDVARGKRLALGTFKFGKEQRAHVS